MNRLKAISGGFFAIIFMGLLAQLIILFIGVGYFKLVKIVPSLSFLTEITTVLLFILTAGIAFTGGIITASLSKSGVIVNCLVTGTLAGILTLAPSLLSGYQITVNGVIFVLVLLFSTLAGGIYISRKERAGTHRPV